MRVAIAFADLTGYTRLTEEEGELTALDAVERFVEAVENTLPEEARVIKTIGDEAMIVGSDPAALTDWAVGFQRLHGGRPLPRIAVHYGVALFRDGDYYGRDVNIASRVAARAAGGEVLVTRPVVETSDPAPIWSTSGSPRSSSRASPTDRDLHRAPARRGMMSDLLAPVREGGLLAPGRPSWCSTRAGATPPACSTSPSAWPAPSGCSPCTSTTGCAARPTTTNAIAGPLWGLRVELELRRPRRQDRAGNLQAWAREERYSVAATLARERGADIAAGHTATDQVETILYRLASSPSRRALLGMRLRDGLLVRPLLGFTRAQTPHIAWGAVCSGARTKQTSQTRTRATASGRLVPALEAAHPAAQANVLALAEVLRDEAEVLDAAVDQILAAPRRSPWRGCASCPRHCVGWSCSAWPTTPPASPPRASGAAPGRWRRCGTPGPSAWTFPTASGRRRGAACCGSAARLS